MPACGGTHDPDPFWIETPFLSSGPHRSNRARRIPEHDRMTIPGRAQAIFQNKTRDTLFVEKAGIVITLVVCQAAVTTARTNNKCRTRCFLGFWQIESESRDIFIFLAQ